MALKISAKSRGEVLREARWRYQRRGKEGRSQLLDEVCALCGLDRKYAIKVLGGKRLIVGSGARRARRRARVLRRGRAGRHSTRPNYMESRERPRFRRLLWHRGPPLSGGVGFYMGDHPQELSDVGATIIEGRLGIMPVRWYKVLREDGTLEKRTQVHFGSTYTGDIWVYSTRQSDLDALHQGAIELSHVFSKT